MRRWIGAALGLLAFVFLPTPGTELGQLHPVCLLTVETAERQICLKTDTGQLGWGETLDAAVKNLEQTTPGHLFLDTVQILIVRPDARFLIPDLRGRLRPDVRVCQSEDAMDMEGLAEYLSRHTPKTRLSDASADGPLQTLSCTEGRYLLEE